MSIRADLGNQVKQTVLPKWKPLLPLFEAVMNSFQAIKAAKLPATIPGIVTIEIDRDPDLFKEDDAQIVGFRISDNGIGIDDDNFDSFNTAFSRHKEDIGGKGLGRFTWLKAFREARIETIFRDDKGERQLLKREFIFNDRYDLDTPELGLPKPIGSGQPGTTVHLSGLLDQYKKQVPRSVDTIIHKLIEHFILVLLELDCPRITVIDQSKKSDINKIFETDYKAAASAHTFVIENASFTLHGFRLPTSRTTKHKLVYAAHQRAVQSDKLEDFLPNLKARLEDEDDKPFFYLAIVQSPYLSAHVNPIRTDFDFSIADDEEAAELELAPGERLIPRSEIREQALPFIQDDLREVIQTINAAKLEKIEKYVHQEAPQYRILLRQVSKFLDKVPPSATRSEMETALHRELYNRETELKKEGSRIIKEAEKVDDYVEYHRRFKSFLEEYNELGVSALAQYVGHRKIILEFLERAITIPEGETKYPLEKVVHQLVFPMRSTSEDISYSEQNLWMIDERLTFHSFIASDKKLKAINILDTTDEQRGDIVVFDQKIILSDDNPVNHPINSLVVVEFKKPGRTHYRQDENPVLQAAKVIESIRNSTFKINGRAVPVANAKIPAMVFCVCDLTPRLRDILDDFDANVTPDNQGYYGYHRKHEVYYEVIDYTKMLRDAVKRNRIFFDKLNLVDNH
jgi:hypothetical protein